MTGRLPPGCKTGCYYRVDNMGIEHQLDCPNHNRKPEPVDDRTYLLSSAQALKLMAISVMIKDGELKLAGDDAETAINALRDIGEEIALQFGNGEPTPPTVVSLAHSNVADFQTRRFEKIDDPAKHSARLALEVGLKWYDNNPEPPNHAIVLFGRLTDDGGSGTRFFQAGDYAHHSQMGLLLEGMHMIRESGRG